MKLVDKEILKIYNESLANGISIFIEKDKLKYRKVKGCEINSDFLMKLKHNKKDLICFLKNKELEKTKKSITEFVDFNIRDYQEHIPLSFAQERLWFIDKLQGSVQYHQPVILRLQGRLDKDILESSFIGLVSRHEILRTVIKEEDGVGYQYIEEEASWSMDYIEDYGFTSEENLQLYLDELINIPYVLSEESILRVHLIRLSGEEHILLVMTHHIGSDGWSVSVMIDEFVELYNAFEAGREISLAALPIQYADYSLWQRDYLSGELLEDKLKYWEDILGGVAPLELSTDYVRPAIQSTQGASRGIELEGSLLSDLQVLCRDHDVTMFMLLLSVFKVLLYRYSGQVDICVGSPIAGRTQKELEGLIGFFINTLALRSRFNGDIVFTDLLEEVKQTTLGAYEHQDVPFEKIVDHLGVERDMSRSALFQVMFVLQNTPESKEGLSMGDITIAEEGSSNTTSLFDLTLSVTEHSEGLSIGVEYCTALFMESTIAGMLIHYKELLLSVIQAPGVRVGDLDMLTNGERHEMLEVFNDTAVEYPRDKSVVDLFEEQVEACPDAVALVYEDSILTYQELNKRSNQLGHYLIEEGVREHSLVGICLDRSLDMVIGILGILKSGAGYVPMDPSYPEDRISYILEDTGVSLVLSSGLAVERLQFQKELLIVDLGSFEYTFYSDLDIALSISWDSLAYIIYTSGSTGIPKGVMVAHSGLDNLLSWYSNYFSFDSDLRVLQQTNMVVDIAYQELFLSFLEGGVLIIPRGDLILDRDYIRGLISVHSISFIQLIPDTLSAYLLEGDLLDSLQYVLVGGDRLPSSLGSSIVSKGYSLYNMYGQTETTIDTLIGKVGKEGVNFQDRVSNVTVYVLDARGMLSPKGVVGELVIGGSGVCRGYLNNVSLSSDRFVIDSAISNQVLYKTGDMARFLGDGSIVFEGRKDSQVKIRGYRVELGEVEQVLERHSNVRESVMVSDREKDRFLCYYTLLNSLELWPLVGDYYLYDEVLYKAMTEDILRNAIYKRAFDLHVKDKVVVDIGTGRDAILSRFCIASGAKRVYAIEFDEAVYESARSKIISLGLSDRIILIHGDAMGVELPELVDVCVSEILGGIGGSEGAPKILKNAWRFVKPGGVMIPSRSRTYIAGVSLPDYFVDSPGFSNATANYVGDIFESVGYPFDLRLSIKGLDASYLISEAAIFEDLVFDGSVAVDLEYSRDITLRITRSSRLDGFLLWLEVSTVPGDKVDSLSDDLNWLPVYFPVFSPGLDVDSGDVIRGVVFGDISSNGLNPDYRFVGSIDRQNGDSYSFNYHSYHCNKDHYQSAGFYASLFSQEDISIMNSQDIGEELRLYLEERLPSYMIPSDLIVLKEFPLTDSGSIDMGSLPDPELGSLGSSGYVAPRTAVERDLAGVWADLLRLDRVGIEDNFFALGGDSIITIQVVSRVRRLGYSLQPRDIFQHQTISGLSKVLDSGSLIKSEQGVLSGSLGLLPVQQWFFTKSFDNISHDNMSMLLSLDKSISVSDLALSVSALVSHHDGLRMVFEEEGGVWHQYYGDIEGTLIEEYLLDVDSSDVSSGITDVCEYYQGSLDIYKGEVVRFVLLKTPDYESHDRLFIVVHHLVMDGISWRILWNDLESCLSSLSSGSSIDLGYKSSSLREWHDALLSYSQRRSIESQLDYWLSIESSYVPLPLDYPGGLGLQGDTLSHTVYLSSALTESLLRDVHSIYNTTIDDLLLCSLGLTLQSWSGQDSVVIGLDRHGREDISEEVDISNTLGWFTNTYPVGLDVSSFGDLGDVLKGVKEGLRLIPDKGLGYGVLKYLHPDRDLRSRFSSEDSFDLLFNYLGQIDNAIEEDSLLGGSTEDYGSEIGALNTVFPNLNVVCIISGGSLEVTWDYVSSQYEPTTIIDLANSYMDNLRLLIAHCLDQEQSEPTPSDYGLEGHISVKELDTFMSSKNYLGERHKDILSSLYRLSPLQEGMLFHGLYDMDSPSYVIQESYDFQGLEIDLLKDSFIRLVVEHSIFRTAFYPDSFLVPVQGVYKEVDLPFEILDYRSLTEEVQEDSVKQYLEEDMLKGFLFEEAPLLRVTVFKLSDTIDRVVWTYHHILMDGWSQPLIVNDLLRFYNTLQSGGVLPQLKEDNYGDYISYINARDKDKEQVYWEEYLSGIEGASLLPFVPAGVERNKGIGSYKSIYKDFGSFLTLKIKDYVQQHHLTINTFFEGVWGYLLSKYIGQDDVLYRIVVSGRPDDLKDVETRIGMYLNNLPLYVTIQEDYDIVLWLKSIQEDQARSQEYQYTSLIDIKKWLGLQGDLYDSGLSYTDFSTVVSSEDDFDELEKEGGLKVLDYNTKYKTNDLLNLKFNLSQELSLEFLYNSTLLSDNYIEMIWGHFSEVCNQIVNSSVDSTLGDLDMLTREERYELLEVFNDTAVEYPRDKSVIDLFEEQVSKSPDSIALVYEDSILTYQELNKRSNQLGHYLQDQGVKENSLVGICLDRSLDMVIGILGILKSGGGYVPMDPSYPEDRISYMLEDTGVSLVLSSGLVVERLKFQKELLIVDLASFEYAVYSDLDIALTISWDSLAYIIYTSGSTGIPKGVLIHHNNVVRLFKTEPSLFDFDSCDTWTFFHSFSFDFSVWELFGSLLNGSQLIVLSESITKDFSLYSRLIVCNKVSVLNSTPAAFYALQEDLLSDLNYSKYLRTVIFGGDALDPIRLKDFKDHYPWCKLINMYGITETTVHVTYKLLDEQDIIPSKSIIGKPIPTLQVYVLDEDQNLLSKGVIGELYVGGLGLSRGYLNRVELTTEKFIASPFKEGGRLYKTGDLCRWNREGNLEFIGRIDDQVKIRGYRIELGEIESVLVELPDVKQGVVLAIEDDKGAKRLVGYVVVEGDFDKADLKAQLGGRLPSYMVPEIWVELEELPLTSNGKVDRQGLPSVDLNNLSSKAYVAPRNEIEENLVAIWSSVLGLESVGIHDNFFEIGGNSLLAINMISFIKKRMKIKIPIRIVFELNEIASLAEYIKLEKDQVILEKETIKIIEL